MTFRVFIVMTLTLCCLFIAESQETVVREKTAANIVSFESHFLRQDSMYQVIVPARIRFDFFVFTRSMANPSAEYSARGEMSVELIDSTETSVARQIEQVELVSNDNAQLSLKTKYVQKLFSFRLRSGRYSIAVKIEDKESKRQYVDNRSFITIVDTRQICSNLIPVQQFTDRRFTLFNLGGDVLFSQNYGFVFQSKKYYSTVSYSLYKLQPDGDERETIESKTAVPVETIANMSCTASEKSNTIELAFGDPSDSHLQYIQMNGLQLRQGRYQLELTFPDSTKLKTSFGARWLDMPASLADLDIAIEPLQFITTKSDYSELRSGGRDSRIKKFEEFWRKKDTSPASAYNEVMHEFYRRVDFAFMAFRTLREINGAITDRGKIYILNGAPSSTERQLNPDGGPKEIWYYQSTKKVFTFEDPGKQGNYKLTESK